MNCWQRILFIVYFEIYSVVGRIVLEQHKTVHLLVEESLNLITLD